MSNAESQNTTTSSNLGPGFDVFGLALSSPPKIIGRRGSCYSSALLELQVTVSPGKSVALFNCEVTCERQGAEGLHLAPNKNLITQVALYVLRCSGHHGFPSFTQVHIINGIELARGLGLSGAAVVAGSILGNEVGGFGMTKDRLLDYCLMVEVRHCTLMSGMFTEILVIQTMLRTFRVSPTWFLHMRKGLEASPIFYSSMNSAPALYC